MFCPASSVFKPCILTGIFHSNTNTHNQQPKEALLPTAHFHTEKNLKAEYQRKQMERTGKSHRASAFGLLFFLLLSICISLASSSSVNPEEKEVKVKTEVEESQVVRGGRGFCVQVLVRRLLIYASPFMLSAQLGQYNRGDIVTVINTSGPFYQTNRGWIQNTGNTVRTTSCTATNPPYNPPHHPPNKPPNGPPNRPPNGPPNRPPDRPPHGHGHGQ